MKIDPMMVKESEKYFGQKHLLKITNALIPVVTTNRFVGKQCIPTTNLDTKYYLKTTLSF